MNRYLVFASVWYYPGGGWFDFQGDFESLPEAKDALKRYVYTEDGSCVSGHVVDTEVKKIIWEATMSSEGKYSEEVYTDD